MAIQRNKLNIGKARRRVQIRSALLLTLGACLIVSFVRLLVSGFSMPYAMRWLLESGTVLLAFGGGAYLGLCVLDGNHRKIVPLRKLSRGQILWLSLLGVLFVCPASLASELFGALAGQRYQQADGVQMLGSARFAAMVVKSALLAPVCEELFFRGYLLPALRPQGSLRAAVVVSLCFGLVHGSGNWAAHMMLSLLLCWMALYTQSLLAPVLVHASYNLMLILLESIGLSGLVAGWSLVSCVVRLAGCAALIAVLRRAYIARPAGGAFALWEGGKLTKREASLLAGCALLLLATLIMGG
ncbi:MAG: CPBP family intramembrane metalloprotease [Clostridia bacterium]|nr:CPBP family intramembrane metalloprotease [Clostridia bacterium]